MLRISFVATLLVLILLSTLTCPVFAQPRRDNYDLFEIEYNWLEIEDTGEPLVDIRNNDFFGPYNIGYPFQFYGQIYEQFWVSSNGFIGFGPIEGYNNFENEQFPTENVPNNIIAPYWKDLDPSAFWADGVVLQGLRNGKRVIQYHNVGERNEDGRSPENVITMQIILEPNGDIIFQYREIGEEFDLDVGTIGIENLTGTQGLTLRNNGEGIDIQNETALLVSTHGPGSFLIWDATAETESGNAQEAALRALDHTVAHLRFLDGEGDQLPEDLREFEAVFINLGNYGINGEHYHPLTEAEGQVVADYIEAGGAVYLEGSDTWNNDDATNAHPYFHINGIADGERLDPPVMGHDGTFTEGFRFNDYQAQHNAFVDHLQAQEGAEGIFSFIDNEEEFVGMVAFMGEAYRTIGCSFEFGGLVDGDRGTKEQLMDLMIEFFRSPPPEFPPPLNLVAQVGDGEVTLSWDHPRRAQQIIGRNVLDLQREIARLSQPRNSLKPSDADRDRIVELREQLETALLASEQAPQRDELESFQIFMNGEEYAFTNAHELTVIELENNQLYLFAVRAVYSNPNGVSEIAGPVFAVPTAIVGPGWTQDFEQFNGALNPIPAQDAWQWGNPEELDAHSGDNVWGTVIDSPYPNLADFQLYLPQMNLEEVGDQIWFSFFHYLDVEEGWDGCQVQISSDGGDRWSLLSPVGGYTADDIFALNAGSGYTGTFDDWEEALFDLGEYVGEVVQIRFNFQSDDSNFRPYTGWFIDDLTIEEPVLGSLLIIVADDLNEEPIVGAEVELEGFGIEFTDNNGHARFNEVPIAGNPWQFHVRNQGYIQIDAEANLRAEELVVQDFFMFRWDSDLNTNPEEFVVNMNFGEEVQRPLTLINTGESPTNYDVYIDHFIGQNFNAIQDDIPQSGLIVEGQPRRDDPWELIQTFDLTAETGEQFFIGAEFIRTNFGQQQGPEHYRLIASAGDFQSGDCRFYHYDRNGNFIEHVSQDINRNRIVGWGLRDLTYDGTSVYGAQDERIYEMSGESGLLRGEFTGAPLEINRAIAYVPDEDVFWVGDWDDGLYKVDRNSNILDRNLQHGLTGVTGMAWNPSDPDGAYLYIHNQESENGGAAIYRYNPETREMARQIETAAEGEGFGGGMFVTYLYDTHSYVVGALIQGEDGDIVKLYELYPHDSWISVTPIAGDLAGGAETELTVTFKSENLFDEVRMAQIEIIDRMTGTIHQVHCELVVEGGAASLNGTVVLDDDEPLHNLTTVFLHRQDIAQAGIEAIPDEDGLFSFPRLSPGDYILEVDNEPRYIPFVSDVIQLAPDEVIENLEVTLFPAEEGGLTGVVTSVYVIDGENQILEDVEIIAVLLGDNREVFTEVTDENGEFFMELPVGTYDVTAYRENWARMTVADVVIENQNDTALDFEMDDRANIRAVHTNGGYDDRIVIHWLPPGLGGDFSNVQMHSGVVSNAIYLQEDDDIIATRFDIEGQFDISRLDLYTTRRNGPVGGNNGWPDGSLNDYRVHIFTEDPETGLPGEEIFRNQLVDRMRNNGNGWDTLNTFDEPTLRFMEGPFYLGWSQDPDEWGTEAVGLDESYDNDGTSFVRFSGEWQAYDQIPGDQVVGVVIWSQFEDEQRLIRRQVRHIPGGDEDVLEDSIDSVVLLNPAYPGSRVPSLAFDWSRGYTHYRNPQRDDIIGFMVYIHNGDERIPALEAPLDPGEFEWIHEINGDDEDNENTEYIYSIGAIFPNPEDVEESEELDGIEVSGVANMSPGPVEDLEVEIDGLSYTITWEPPFINADFSRCVDYAGCELYVDGEQVAIINDPEVLFWEGELEEGQDGWHTVGAVAFDEVPNRSVPEEIHIPLGQAIVFDFENNTPVFNAEPRANSWRRSDFLRNGPDDAHSGDFAYATRPNEGEYENDVTWSITTIPEFFVDSESGRLEFYHFLETETGHDGGQLQISVNGGEWELIVPVDDYPDQNVAGLINTPGFSGRTNGWELVSFDLSEYADALVRFKWVFASDHLISNYPGWYLDDVVFWGCTIPEYARISGIVSNQDGQPVPNATVTNGRETVTTNFNGIFFLSYTLPGDVTVTISKAGFHPTIIEDELEANEAQVLEVDLIEARLTVDPEALEFDLGGNDRLDVELILTNETNRETPFWVRVLSNPGIMNDGNNRRSVRTLSGQGPQRDDPWDVVFEWNATDRGRYSRIMGAEFAEDKFILTCADPVAGPVLSVLDWEGNYLSSFNQPVEIIGWGLRDLAWDGELLYASQNNRIYGFTTRGEFRLEQPGAPIELNRALAYDAELDGFWTAEWNSDWYFVDRQGEVQVQWAEHGLTGIYGFAIHPNDPDGMFLYAVNLEEDGSTGIYRSNPIEGTIEQVHTLDGAPTGCFITGAWDEDRWILGSVTGSGEQYMTGLELNRRFGFLSVDPESGMIEPDGELTLTLSVDVPFDAEEGDEYEGEIIVRVYGDDAVTIPFTANIIDGFQHFDNPPITEDFHTITIENVEYGMGELPVGSEIAVYTPRDQIGGVHRWLMPPGELFAYQAEDGFQQGEQFRFVVWVPDDDMEYEGEAEVIEGPGIFRVGGETSIILTIGLPERQVVDLIERWNLVSIYIDPFEPMVADVLGDINDRGNLVIAKDGIGRFWWPAQNFNGLGEWNSLGGYQINVTVDESFTAIGDRIPTDTPIHLNLGWNAISYLLGEEIESRIAFSEILDRIQIAKDGTGLFLVPEFGFFGLRTLIPGQGYKVKVTEALDLVYNPGDGGMNRIGTPALDGKLQPTGSDMSLLITEINGANPEPGLEILVNSNDDGRLIGHGYYTSDPCGIIIRGDDPATVEIEGAVEGEEWSVSLKSKVREHQLKTKVLYGDDNYSSDGFSVIRSEIVSVTTPQEFVIDRIYPNPFNNRTTLHFGLPEKTRLSGVIINLKGQTVAQIEATDYSAGWHKITINAEGWPSGIYMMNVSTPRRSYARKLVLIQ
ncbi:MAG: T9SS type A sorting domain-containing protein [Calditrichaeota bacterium]|nr:T9SS type A sorting domain-containing protein [Calditrichota bacterium]